MNWLAHVALSPNHAQFQLGNLLADIVPKRDETHYPLAFQAGCACHRAIDAFTDAHPLVHEAKALVGAGALRYAGVVLDIYFDHLLATHWASFYSAPLRDFTTAFYAAATPQINAWPHLPPAATLAWSRIVEHDVLGSMTRVDSVAFALGRISARWNARFKRDIDLQPALAQLETHRDAVTERFMAFYPQLQTRARETAESLETALQQA